VTLREALAGPGGSPPRRTWSRLVQLLRAHRRRTGQAPVHGGMASLQAALDRPLRGGVDPAGLRDRLRALATLAGEEQEDAAATIDALIAGLVCAERAEPVTVAVSGWPRGFGPDEQERILGHAPGRAVEPHMAAALIHRLDGLRLGGSRLAVSVTLAADEVLPPPRRGDRADLRRGRVAWLPHLDDVGRFSATPEGVAHAQARALAAVHDGVVLDPFCGCGGSAIALALAGLDVVAIERDPSRARMAARNARHLGVADRVTVLTGDAQRLLPGLMQQHESAAVFLDPPWGAAEAEGARTALTWSTFLPRHAAAFPGRVVLAKLPRDFDLSTLPSPGAWEVAWEFGSEADGSAHVPKVITALRR